MSVNPNQATGSSRGVPPESKVIAVKLPRDLYKQVHHRAVDEGRPVRAIVMEALERFIDPAAQWLDPKTWVEDCDLCGGDHPEGPCQ